MIQRVTRIHLVQPNEPIFAPYSYTIEIEDEAAGEFIVVTDQNDNEPKPNAICIDPRDWPFLRAAIDRMIYECAKDPEPVEEPESQPNDP